jgi:hypothetical protein
MRSLTKAHSETRKRSFAAYRQRTASHGRNHSAVGCGALNHRTLAFSYVRGSEGMGKGPEACPGQAAHRPVLHRSPPSGGACLHVPVVAASPSPGRRTRAERHSPSSGLVALARRPQRPRAPRYGGWLHKQNQTLSQISAREMTRPRTPNLLHCIIGLSYTCTCVAVLQLRAHTVTLLYLYWSHLLQFRVFIHLGCCCKQCCS